MSDTPIIRFPQRQPQPHPGRPTSDIASQSEYRHLPPAGRQTTSAPLAESPLAVVLGAAGHSHDCIMGMRSGRSLACSCGAAPEPLENAAKAVGMAIRFARIAATRQVAIPRGVVAALVEQVDRGNAAAILVWQWLARRGQIPATSGLRPKLRLVCERA